MPGHTDYGASDLSSTQITGAVTGARSSIAPPPGADGLALTSCKHERASGRLRLADGGLLCETVCDNDACGAVLHVFPPLTYRMPSMASPMPAEAQLA
jgi:hypothetical protein